MRLPIAIIFSLLFSSCAGPHTSVMNVANDKPVVLSDVVTEDTVLSGKVLIESDLLIPEGITLTLKPGTGVTVVPSEGTRTDSQFITTETEILVKGTLVLENASIATASGIPGSWGGVISASPLATVRVTGAAIRGARFGIMALEGTVEVTGSLFEGNEVGIARAPGAQLTTSANTYRDNGIATASWHLPVPIRSPGDTFSGNGDDTLALDTAAPEIRHRPMSYTLSPPPPVTREYLGEVALDENTTWRGTVVIDGQVAVPEDVTLTIEPGTRVLFTFRDTNRDGMGESWIIAQGTVRVLGEEDAWVLFDAEDENARPGAWDSLSVIASDSPGNLVRYAVFRRGIKAFHNHFSRARLDHVVFEDNLRGIQFQESEDTIIDWAVFIRNQSGARFRDSTVTLSNVVAKDNVAAINFLRSRVDANDILVTGSFAESFVSRESVTDLVRAAVVGNVSGPRFKGEGEKVTVRESLVMGNLTEGLSLSRVHGEVRYCSLTGNGFTGLSVSDADVIVSNSRLAGNGRFAVDNGGSTPVTASGNDWGTGSGPDPDSIYDEQDEEGIGRVYTAVPLHFSMAFPGMDLTEGSSGGEVLVVGDVTTAPDRQLNFKPGTRILFSIIEPGSLFDLGSDHPSFPRSELTVHGRIYAVGTADNPVYFSQIGPASLEGVHWGAVNLTDSRGGRFEDCVIFNAATGIHAREAGVVVVRKCVFERNEVGLRFSRAHMEAAGNLFRSNGTALRFHEFGGVVEKNTFDNNGTAVFVTGNPEDLTLRDNVFAGSTDYHVKLGIHVTDDVAIEGGRFEVPEEKIVEDLVFDREDDPDLGRVIFIP